MGNGKNQPLTASKIAPRIPSSPSGAQNGNHNLDSHAAAPLGRIRPPNDIAKIGVFLASDESGWVSGERIEGAGGHP